MNTGAEGFAQPTDVPYVPREAQEIIVAATETIKADKVTIDSRSERIKMLKDQLALAQDALKMAKENNTLTEEVRADMESEIVFLKDSVKNLEKELRREKAKKIAWKVFAIIEGGFIVYLII